MGTQDLWQALVQGFSIMVTGEEEKMAFLRECQAQNIRWSNCVPALDHVPSAKFGFFEMGAQGHYLQFFTPRPSPDSAFAVAWSELTAAYKGLVPQFVY